MFAWLVCVSVLLYLSISRHKHWNQLYWVMVYIKILVTYRVQIQSKNLCAIFIEQNIVIKQSRVNTRNQKKKQQTNPKMHNRYSKPEIWGKKVRYKNSTKVRDKRQDMVKQKHTKNHTQSSVQINTYQDMQ